MLVRKAFITNSSSTAYVAYGMMYRSEDKDEWAMIEQAVERAKADWHDRYKADSKRSILEESYRVQYKAKHPEKVEMRSSPHYQGGKPYEYISIPASVQQEDYEGTTEPFVWITTGPGGGSENYEPEVFDPYAVPREKMDDDLAEFCDLMGINYKQPKWYVKGTPG